MKLHFCLFILLACLNVNLLATKTNSDSPNDYEDESKGKPEDQEDPDREKKRVDHEKMKPLLEKHRRAMRVKLDKLAKEQKSDVEFQRLLKEIKDARAKYPNEEKKPPKGIV